MRQTTLESFEGYETGLYTQEFQEKSGRAVLRTFEVEARLYSLYGNGALRCIACTIHGKERTNTRNE